MAFPIGTSEQALVNQINQDNALPVPLVVGDLYYGKVVKLSDGYVSVPSVIKADNEDYEGYRTFEYKRFNLSMMFSGITPVVTDVAYPSVHALLPVLNKRLGLNLSKSDVINQNLVWSTGGEERVNLQITASPQSLAFEGSFILTYIKVRPAIDSVLTQRNLPVLRHPSTPPTGKLSLDMQTWGLSFTDNSSILTVRSGLWVNPTAVRNLMVSLGFAGFPAPAKGDVTVQATANVPDSNQTYSKVAIQKNVIGPNYQGTAYFHFD